MTMYQQKRQNNIVRIVSDFLISLPFAIHGKSICVCLSGGADSVALLQVFLMLKDEYGFKVRACHFNHCIRGDEADSDEFFCKRLCDSLGVEIFLGRDDVISYSKLTKKSLEESARECRYAFFSRVLSKNSIDFCATAHNMNDDAETLLLNLIRGSGSNGATAIEPFNEHYLRPFLSVKRADIETFLLDIGQDYITDSTNKSNDFTRNYIRNEVFPLLERINPSVVEAFSRFIKSSRSDREYFESIISNNDNLDLREVHSAIRTRMILRNYKVFSGRILNTALLNDIERAFASEKRSIVPLFSDDEAIVDNGRIFFQKRVEPIHGFSEHVLKMGENHVFNDNLNIILSNHNDYHTDYLTVHDNISSEKISGEIRVRTRQTGDRIVIKGMNKSLKKLFIDNKIPKEYRSIIPIFFDDEGIIYVPFIGISDRVFSKSSENKLTITTVFNTIDKERWSLSYEK